MDGALCGKRIILVGLAGSGWEARMEWWWLVGVQLPLFVMKTSPQTPTPSPTIPPTHAHPPHSSHRSSAASGWCARGGSPQPVAMHKAVGNHISPCCLPLFPPAGQARQAGGVRGGAVLAAAFQGRGEGGFVGHRVRRVDRRLQGVAGWPSVLLDCNQTSGMGFKGWQVGLLFSWSHVSHQKLEAGAEGVAGGRAVWVRACCVG